MENMGLEELCTVIAAVFVSLVNWICLIVPRPLLGKHFADVLRSPNDAAKIPEFALWIWIANLLYVPSMCAMKLSILFLYWRLFGVDRKRQLFLILIGGIVVAWSFAIFFASVFSCNPVAGSYDVALALTAKCINKRAFYFGASIPNVITDCILVVIPIRYVWKLNAPTAQRVILACIFALGIFVCVVSMVRLSVLLETTQSAFDLTYTYKDVYLWSVVELNVGLICICLPSLRPIIRVIGLGSLFPSLRSGRTRTLRTPNLRDDAHNGGGSGPSEVRKPGNPFFRAVGGSGPRGEDDDELEMMGEQESLEGKSGSWAGHTASRISNETDAVSQGSALPRNPPDDLRGGITVHKDWRVTTSSQ